MGASGLAEGLREGNLGHPVGRAKTPSGGCSATCAAALRAGAVASGPTAPPDHEGRGRAVADRLAARGGRLDGPVAGPAQAGPNGPVATRPSPDPQEPPGRSQAGRVVGMGARGRGTAVGAAGGARWAGTVRDWLSRGAQTVGFACAALLGDRYARGEARIVLSSRSAFDGCACCCVTTRDRI